MCKILQQIGRIFLYRASSPVYAGIVTFLIIFAGGYGSLFTQEIRSAFPFSGGPYDGLSREAIIFWLLVALAAFTFFLRQWAVDNASNEARRELIRQIQTLPPADFLAYFAKIYDSCDAAYKKVIDLGNISLLKQTTRAILRGIALLAHKFDSATEGTLYAANIMEFKATKNLTITAAKDISKRLKFCEPELAIHKLLGVLDLQCDLSATINSKGEADSSLTAFALPIPKEHKVDGSGGKPLFRILPGGPFAFVSREPDIYADTSELLNWCRESGDFTANVTEQIKSYFSSSEAENVKSFISLPLISEEGQDPVGVLNIHRDKPASLLMKHVGHILLL